VTCPACRTGLDPAKDTLARTGRLLCWRCGWDEPQAAAKFVGRRNDELQFQSMHRIPIDLGEPAVPVVDPDREYVVPMAKALAPIGATRMLSGQELARIIDDAFRSGRFGLKGRL
jgi:hypothetical protein